jgi:hypothetical protein
MTYLYRWSAVPAVGLLLAAHAVAVAPEVRDEGKFFSAEAIKKADERAAEIYRKYDRDVLIETYATVPAADVEKVKGMDAKERSQYSLSWAKERAQRRAVNGVYILICKEPRILRVGVEERGPRKFPDGTQAEIDKVLKKELTDGHFDQVLEQALRIVEERLGKGK